MCDKEQRAFIYPTLQSRALQRSDDHFVGMRKRKRGDAVCCHGVLVSGRYRLCFGEWCHTVGQQPSTEEPSNLFYLKVNGQGWMNYCY